jgi:hypothetical protein
MTWLPADLSYLIRPDLMAAAIAGAALALLLRRLLPLLAFGLLALLLWKPDILHQLRAALAAANFSFDLPDQTVISFAVGLVTGFTILASLLHVRYLGQALIVAVAILLAYGLATEGVNALVAHANAAVRHLLQNQAFVTGLATGKLLAGLVKWHHCRRRRDWPR